MRTELYNNIDEMIHELAQVVVGRSYGKSMDWTPKRREGLYALSGQFPELLIKACTELKYDYDIVNRLSLNPCLYLKTAYRFQMITKALPIDINTVSDCFMYLMNCSVLARKNRVNEYYSYALDNYEMFNNSEDAATKKIVSFINADLRAYSELIYCDDHSVGGEIIGPIPLGKYNMVVRDYNNFIPYTMNFVPLNIPYKRIRTFCLYKCSDIEVDINGNLQGHENMVDGLEKFMVTIENDDGSIFHCTSLKQLKLLLNNLDLSIVDFKHYYDGLKYEFRTQLLIDTQYFALKDFFEAANINWEDACINNRSYMINPDYLLANKRHRKPFFEIKQNDELFKFTKEMIDPRIKWLDVEYSEDINGGIV